MKKLYISPIIEMIESSCEEMILATSDVNTGQEFGNGEGSHNGGLTSEEDEIITLSKGGGYIAWGANWSFDDFDDEEDF